MDETSQRQRTYVVDAPPRDYSLKGKYLVQVALCEGVKCKRRFTKMLEAKGMPVYRIPKREKMEFVELISSRAFNRSLANEYVELINSRHRGAGFASEARQSNGTYRISMGLFPALDRAKEVKSEAQKLFEHNEVVFSLELREKNHERNKIAAGPFSSRSAAQSALRSLKKDPQFRQAFLTTRK